MPTTVSCRAFYASILKTLEGQTVTAQCGADYYLGTLHRVHPGDPGYRWGVIDLRSTQPFTFTIDQVTSIAWHDLRNRPHLDVSP